MQIEKFKIHASQTFQIMSEPKLKSAKDAGELSETAKTFCELWLKERIYQRRKEINSKYFDKGNQCEQKGIDRYNNSFGTFYTKNETFFENDFCCGTPDIIGITEIIDIKNSYDFTTFPLFDTVLENKAYEYQLQAYMELTGIKNAKLCYVLENLPDELIERELNRFGLEFTKDNAENYTYDNISDNFRIKVFETSYNTEIIEKIKSQVVKCQIYINKLIESWNLKEF